MTTHEVLRRLDALEKEWFELLSVGKDARTRLGQSLGEKAAEIYLQLQELKARQSSILAEIESLEETLVTQRAEPRHEASASPGNA